MQLKTVDKRGGKKRSEMSMRLGKVLKWSRGLTNNGLKRKRTCQKWSKSKQTCSIVCKKNSRSGNSTTRHTQFIYRSLFVKCQFKGDMSKTCFRSLCEKGLFWPQERVISRAIRVRLTWSFHRSIALCILFKIKFRISHKFLTQTTQKNDLLFWP